MNIKVSQTESNIIEVALSGRFDAEGVNRIRTQFLGLVEPKPKLVIVDLADVDFLASAGIRLLLIAAKSLEKGEGKLALARPKNNVLHTLNITGIDNIIPIYKTIRKAREAWN